MHLTIRITTIFSLICCSTQLQAQGSFQRQAQSKKSFICQAGGAIWNQNVPCDQPSPERNVMLKRVNYDEQIAKKQILARAIERLETKAALIQLKNFPERFVGQTIKIENILISGDIRKNESEQLKEGSRTEIDLIDQHARSITVGASDRIGMELSVELNPALLYHLQSATLDVEDGPAGFVAYLKAFDLDDRPAVKRKATANQNNAPILGKVRAAAAEQDYEYNEYEPVVSSAGKNAQAFNPATENSPAQAQPHDPSALMSILQQLGAQQGPTANKHDSQPSQRKFGEIEFKSDDPNW